jgi:glycogen synthase
MPEKPLHVCLISMEFPPETSRGGVGTYSAIQARALAKLGQSVTVIAQGLSRNSVAEQDGVVVHRIKEREHPLAMACARRANIAELAGFLIYAERVCEEVLDIHARHPIDVIECPEWALEAVFLHARLSAIPRIVRLHTPQFLLDTLNGIAPTWNRRLIQKLEAWHVLRASAVTSISGSLARIVARQYCLPPASFTVIPNPLDVGLFDALPLPDSRLEHGTIFYSGRLEMRKGVHVLMDAFPSVVAQFPHARLVLAGADTSTAPGGGSYRHWLQSSAAFSKISERVAFLGPLPREEVLGWCYRAGLCVVPSLYEAFGYTCIEAMAAGAAVVASRAGGIPEIISEGNTGLMFEPGNPADLAARIITLLRDPQWLSHIRTNARAHAMREYSDLRVAQKTLEHYRAVVAAVRAGYDRNVLRHPANPEPIWRTAAS